MKLTIFTILVVTLFMTTVAWADLQISGNTNGSTTAVLGGTNDGVTFAPATFASNTFKNSPGTQKGIQIGTFSSYCDGIFCNDSSDPFDLKVTFTLPTGINGGNQTTFVGDIFGDVIFMGIGNYAVRFDNPSQTFAFDDGNVNGHFTFTIEQDKDRNPDIDLANGSSWCDPGKTALLADVTGNWSTDPTHGGGQGTVPEPTSFLLLGTVVCGLAFFRKKLA